MTTTTSQPPAAIILAAGKGTRMKSDLPKVVHLIGGRPMVCAVVDACLAVGCRKIVVIVGYQQEKVREALKGYDRDHHVEFAVQTEQLGTGHAVKCCAENFKAELQASKSSAGSSSNFAFSSFGAPLPSSPCLVLCGDGPLIRPATLNRLLDRHQQSHAAASIATALLEDPAGYGRISRDAARKFKAIVEQKNCTPEQLKIREVNPSYYCFDLPELFRALDLVKKNSLSGEYYLTDTLELLLADGRGVEVIEAVPPEDVLSINTLDDLAKVDAIYRSRPPVSATDINTSVKAGPR